MFFLAFSGRFVTDEGGSLMYCLSWFDGAGLLLTKLSVCGGGGSTAEFHSASDGRRPKSLRDFGGAAASLIPLKMMLKPEQVATHR